MKMKATVERFDLYSKRVMCATKTKAQELLHRYFEYKCNSVWKRDSLARSRARDNTYIVRLGEHLVMARSHVTHIANNSCELVSFMVYI